MTTNQNQSLSERFVPCSLNNNKTVRLPSLDTNSSQKSVSISAVYTVRLHDNVAETADTSKNVSVAFETDTKDTFSMLDHLKVAFKAESIAVSNSGTTRPIRLSVWPDILTVRQVLSYIELVKSRPPNHISKKRALNHAIQKHPSSRN